MDIELHPVTIRDVVDGYTDDGEGGVFGYGGRLNIRPPYQREFVYKEKQRDAVIDTIFKGFPLNVFYWVTLAGYGFRCHAAHLGNLLGGQEDFAFLFTLGFPFGNVEPLHGL